MQTASQVVDNIKLNMADPRMQGICLFVQEVLERKNFISPIKRYRVVDQASGNSITSVTEFIAALRGDAVTMSYPFKGARFDTDRITGYNVRVENLHVVFDPYAEDDAMFDELYGFSHRAGTVFKFQLYMAYLNDADPDMEVKICNIRLVSE